MPKKGQGLNLAKLRVNFLFLFSQVHLQSNLFLHLKKNILSFLPPLAFPSTKHRKEKVNRKSSKPSFPSSSHIPQQANNPNPRNPKFVYFSYRFWQFPGTKQRKICHPTIPNRNFISLLTLCPESNRLEKWEPRTSQNFFIFISYRLSQFASNQAEENHHLTTTKLKENPKLQTSIPSLITHSPTSKQRRKNQWPK